MSLASVLPLIRCPTTRSALVPLSPDELAVLRLAIIEGRAVNRAGENIEQPPLEAVRNADSSWIYLVRHGAVNLLVDEAIAGDLLWSEGAAKIEPSPNQLGA